MMTRLGLLVVVSAGLTSGVVLAQTTFEWTVLELEEGVGGNSITIAKELIKSDTGLYFAGQTLNSDDTWRAAVWYWAEKNNHDFPVPVTLLPDPAHGDSTVTAGTIRNNPFITYNFVGSTTTMQNANVPCVWRSNDGVLYNQTPLSTPHEGAALAIGGPPDELLGMLVSGYIVEGSVQQAAVWELLTLPNTWQRTDLPGSLSGPSAVTAASESRLGGWVTTPGGDKRAAFWEKDNQGLWQVSLPMLTPPTDYDTSEYAVIHACNAKYESMAVWTSSTQSGEFGSILTERAGTIWGFPVTGPNGAPAAGLSWVNQSCEADFGIQIVGTVKDAANVLLPAWTLSRQFPALELRPIIPAWALPEFEESGAVGSAMLDTGTVAVVCTGKYTNGEEHGFLLVGIPRRTDLDNDGDGDLSDFAIFQQQFTGP